MYRISKYIRLGLRNRKNIEILHEYFDYLYRWNSVQQTLLWHQSGCYTCYQGETIRSPDSKMCTCNDALTRGQFLGKFWAFKLTVFVYSSSILFHHNRIEIDTSISVVLVSLTTWEAHHSPRAVVSFSSRWWDNNDLNIGINSYHIGLESMVGFTGTHT